METFYNYKGYGIRYVSIIGTTYIESNGFTMKKFNGFGELVGDKSARDYIDENLT